MYQSCSSQPLLCKYSKSKAILVFAYACVKSAESSQECSQLLLQHSVGNNVHFAIPTEMQTDLPSQDVIVYLHRSLHSWDFSSSPWQSNATVPPAMAAADRGRNSGCPVNQSAHPTHAQVDPLGLSCTLQSLCQRRKCTAGGGPISGSKCLCIFLAFTPSLVIASIYTKSDK